MLYSFTVAIYINCKNVAENGIYVRKLNKE